MLKKFFAFTIVVMFLISACGGKVATLSPNKTLESTANPASGNLPALTGEWTITMTHSGGIMGLMRSIEIISSGSYTVIDERGNQNITGQLSEQELTEIIQVINSSTYSQSGKEYGCADCFVYDIVIMSEGKKFSAQVDDVTIEESGLGTLVSTLRSIIERELK